MVRHPTHAECRDGQPRITIHLSKKQLPTCSTETRLIVAVCHELPRHANEPACCVGALEDMPCNLMVGIHKRTREWVLDWRSRRNLQRSYNLVNLDAGM